MLTAAFAELTSLIETSLVAVFLIGLLGGVHCAGMCGGIVSALGMRTRLTSQQSTQSIAFERMSLASSTGGGAAVVSKPSIPFQSSPLIQGLLLYNASRISTYALLGALAGSIGTVSWLLQTALPIQQIAFAITNVLLILMGLYVAGVRRIAREAERLGQPVWAIIKPHATRRLKGDGALNSLVAGALWGLVPCGMVYGVLMAALVSGGPIQGTLLMLAFGLGTLPNLVALGIAGNGLARASRQLWIRRLAGSLIVLFGVVGLLRLEVARDIPLIRELCQHLPSIS